MEFKQMTRADLESLEYLYSISKVGGKSALIRMCKEKELIPDVVNEFEEDFTKEMFNNSPRMKYLVICSFPELFDIKLWKENKNKSLEPLSHESFYNKLSEKEVLDILMASDPYLITQDVHNFLMEHGTKNIKDIILSRSKREISTYEVINSKDKFNGTTLLNSTFREALSENDMIKLVTVKPCEMDLVIPAIAFKANVSWQKKILNMIKTGEIKIVKSGNQMEATLKVMLTAISSAVIDDVLKLILEYSPNALSYNILEYILDKGIIELSGCEILEEKYRQNNLLNKLNRYKETLEDLF